VAKMKMHKEFFNQVPLLQGLRPDQQELLSPLFTACNSEAGTQLFEQGEPAEYLYLLVRGEVTVLYKPEDGPVLLVSRIKTGGVVGWSSALGNRRYTSGAVCVTRSQLLRVRGEALRSLCEQYPETGVVVLERLAAVIAERLRNTHDEVVTLLKKGIAYNLESC